MADWTTLTDDGEVVYWRDVPERFEAAKEADQRRFGRKHGLRGCHCEGAQGLVVVFSLGRDGETIKTLLPFDEQRQGWFEALAAVGGLVAEAARIEFPLPVAVAPADRPVEYRQTTTAGLTHTVFRASHSQPGGELDHLLAFALGLDGPLDRNRLN